MKTLKTIGYLFLFLITIMLASCKKEIGQKMEIDDNFYIENRNANMPVWVKGNGSSKTFIITVHGGPILGSGFDFSNASFTDKMEEKYTMIYWDQRHSSNSHGHLKKEDMSIDIMLEDMQLLVRVLKEKYGEDISLFIMGHSWGGTLSTAYLSKESNQNDIKGWINISGTPDAKQELIEASKQVVAFADEEISKGNNVDAWKSIKNEVIAIDTNNIDDAAESIIDKEAQKALSFFKDEIYPEKRRYPTYRSLLNAEDPLLLLGNVFQTPQAFMDEVQNIDLVDELCKIEIPTLIQFGKYDIGSSPAIGQLIYDNISSTDKFYDVYEHSEHFAFSQETDLFLLNVISFIEAYK